MRLADYPHETVEIECAKCGRHGRLRKTIAAGSKLTGRRLVEYPQVSE